MCWMNMEMDWEEGHSGQEGGSWGNGASVSLSSSWEPCQGCHPTIGPVAPKRSIKSPNSLTFILPWPLMIVFILLTLWQIIWRHLQMFPRALILHRTKEPWVWVAVKVEATGNYYSIFTEMEDVGQRAWTKGVWTMYSWKLGGCRGYRLKWC